jgi:hypothetical protein
VLARGFRVALTLALSPLVGVVACRSSSPHAGAGTDGAAADGSTTGDGSGTGDRSADDRPDALAIADVGGDSPDRSGIDTAPGDTAPGDTAPGDTAPGDTAPRDAQDNDGAAIDSSGSGADASVADAPSADASSADAPVADAPVGDAPVIDAPATDLPGETVSSDAGDARSGDGPCGALGVSCAPFACDVDGGICKNSCAGNDDCDSQHVCLFGLCGRQPDSCAADVECLSGHCAQGVCCDTACTEACKHCALPGSIGICSFVPPGANPQTSNSCPPPNVCNGAGGCVPSCNDDSECTDAQECDNHRCLRCAATCASSADCTFGAACVHRNSCTSCEPPDAGAGAG